MAGGFIEAGRFIEAGCSIEARESIEAGGHIFSFTFFVYAKRISTRTLPFWRDYWAEMPPLKKWKDRILDESFCWTDYRKMLTKKEAREVCAWDGWHWLLRAHLEMFFGLKKEHVIS
jgi:hypothetical protein